MPHPVSFDERGDRESTTDKSPLRGNDATRELGATLGVAVLGSVFASLYQRSLGTDSLAANLTPGALATAKESFAAALQVANQAGGPVGLQLSAAATGGFMDGLQAACYVAAGVTLAAAAFAAIVLPSGPRS